jgi:hypothetical protein
VAKYTMKNPTGVKKIFNNIRCELIEICRELDLQAVKQS